MRTSVRLPPSPTALVADCRTLAASCEDGLREPLLDGRTQSCAAAEAHCADGRACGAPSEPRGTRSKFSDVGKVLL
jgi:hypothetical protein